MEPTHAIVEALLRQHVSRDLVDLSGLVRDALVQLRAVDTGVRRSVVVVTLLPRLPVDAGAELALALLTRLANGELKPLTRAGLLCLEAATRALHEVHRQLARDLVREALARLGPVTRRLVHDTLVCAEGVDRAVLAKVAASITDESPRVLFVDAAAHDLESWATLLAAEGALADQPHLEQFAALAQAGRGEVLSAERLAVAPVARWLAWLVTSLERAWWGNEDELPPVVSVTRAFVRSRAESRA